MHLLVSKTAIQGISNMNMNILRLQLGHSRPVGYPLLRAIDGPVLPV
jgi:hypothetical protein